MHTQHRTLKRLTAAALAVLTVSCAMAPADAVGIIGDNVTPAYDEAYYATTDYYGNLTEGSVVKSYVLNGATTLVDYGTYDEVVNLTDGTVPVSREDATEFRFDRNNAPSHFYFEGKTSQPFENLPWTISVSYTLNGVPARAEDLAGKTGVVEIRLHILPNENASAYARNNYTLEAMAMFNQDDILSLEAPGAQVQLIGNLRAVLFIALPGEEQHFVIRVGAEDFAFGGLTFMMVPATLAQLEEIAKLSQRKDDLEEDYNKLSGSLDTLLNSFAGLGSSLRATADGLDELNQARDTISSRKDQIYADGDQVLEDLQRLNGSLNTLPGHLKDADDTITEVTDALTELVDTTVGLQDELEDLDECLRDLQRDVRNIRNGTGSMQSNLKKLGEDLKRLQDSVKALREALDILDIEINGGIVGEIPENIKKYIKVQGETLSDLLTGENMVKITALDTVWKTVAKDQDGNAVDSITYAQYQTAALLTSGTVKTPEEAAGLMAQVQAADNAIAQVNAQAPGITDEAALQTLVTRGTMTAEQAAAYSAAKPKLVMMEIVYTTVCGGTAQSMSKTDFFTAMLMLNDISALPADQQTQANIGKILAQKETYAKTAALMARIAANYDTARLDGLLGNLSDLLEHMGSGGITGDLGSLVGKTDTTLGHLNETADVARDILDRIDDILDDAEDLNDTINDQVPGLRETLRDTRTLVKDMVTAIDDTHGFLTSFRSLAKTSGSQLDEGTKKSLENLAETLRRTAHSTDAVGDVKTAKDAVNEIIEDTWREYTGDVNNLLLMDATAEAQSLTSEQNPAPASIQILIRTEEIKAESGDGEAAAGITTEETTFWGRVAQMFRDFWAAVTGIFQ